jgi:hypothetical protein
LIKNVARNIALKESDETVERHPFEPKGRCPFMHDTNKEGPVMCLPYLYIQLERATDRE